MDQMGGQTLQQKGAFSETLVDKPKVQHLEVPEPPVDELARPAGSARGPILRLNEAYGEAARHGIEGRAGTVYTSADHQHVELPGADPGYVVTSPGRRN